MLNTGMEFHQFKVGTQFWTATGKWEVVEVDSTSSTFKAVREDEPDRVHEFDLYDFGGCSTEPF